jgi:hypothetical protein
MGTNMANIRNQLDDSGILRIHSKEGAYVEWEFLLESGEADPTPPNNILLYIGSTPEWSSPLAPTSAPNIRSMTITKAEAVILRNSSLVNGKPQTMPWAVVDESTPVASVLWEGLVEWEGW